MTEALPFQTQQPIFSKMGGISVLSHMDSEERRKYFKSLNKYRTNLSVMEFAVEEGVERRRAEGRIEGRAEGRIEVAKNLKALGIDIDKIVQATGLGENEIESL